MKECTEEINLWKPTTNTWSDKENKIKYGKHVHIEQCNIILINEEQYETETSKHHANKHEILLMRKYKGNNNFRENEPQMSILSFKQINKNKKTQEK